jgi:hypothetical protein
MAGERKAAPAVVRRENERRAWLMRYQERLTLAEIGEALGVDPSTVCRMVQRAERVLAQEFKEQAFLVKCRQTALLETVSDEALRAWERSKLDAVTVTTGRAELDRKGQVVTLPDEVERAGQAGDARLLAQVRGAQQDIRKIWGLDAPASIDLTSGGEPVKLYRGIDLDQV